MKIGEIPANAMIQIRVVRGEKKFECMAVVFAAREDGLYLYPIKHDGQFIDFSVENIQIFAFYVNEKRQAFGWSGCRIRKDIYQRKLCYLLTTRRDSVRVNRRNDPRIRTDMGATLRTLSDDKDWEIVVRNYSENGIGFVCKKSIPERDWNPVSIVYEDRAEQMAISLRVNILRGNELPSGLFKYGGTIQQPDEEWIAYVKHKLEAIKERNQAEGSPDMNTNSH